jgi:hypothetical protein
MARPKVTDRRDFLYGVRLNSRELKALDRLKNGTGLDYAALTRVLIMNANLEQLKAAVGR